jgi:hypothetical protein
MQSLHITRPPTIIVDHRSAADQRNNELTLILIIKLKQETFYKAQSLIKR